MIPLSSRSRESLAPFVLAAAIVTTILLLYTGIAHAVADPTPALTTATDAALSVWTTDGPLWLAIATLYVGLRAFLSRQHWLAQGRILAGLTGLAGIGAAVIAWHFSGAPSAGILTAIVAAIALVQHPTVSPAPAAERDPQAGISRLGALVVLASTALVIVLAVALSGCTAATRQAARDHAAAGVVTALDCEAAHLDAAALADAVHLAEAGLQRAITGVAPGDLAELKAALSADLAPIKSDLGRCGVAGALAALTGAVPARAGLATSALTAPGPDPDQVRLAAQAAARELGWPAVRAAGAVL